MPVFRLLVMKDIFRYRKYDISGNVQSPGVKAASAKVGGSIGIFNIPCSLGR